MSIIVYRIFALYRKETSGIFLIGGIRITPEEILKQAWSEEYDRLRKNRMVMGYFRYGTLANNVKPGMIDTIASLKKRLEAYESTGNTEFLVDIGNFAMIEYMYPQHPQAHFKATEHDEGPGVVGVSVNMVKDYRTSLGGAAFFKKCEL